MVDQLSIVFHTVLSVGLLVGLFDGVEREFSRWTVLDGVRSERQRKDDLRKRGYIL